MLITFTYRTYTRRHAPVQTRLNPLAGVSGTYLSLKFKGDW